MPNTPAITEQSTAVVHADRAVVRAGAEVLREALGSRATIAWISQDEADGVLVGWAGRAGAARRLRLAARGAAPDPATGEASDAEPHDVVWVLPRATAEHRAALRARGEHFVDLGGAVHLTLPWALIDRTDLTPVRPASARGRSQADPFADRSSLVLRTLLGPGDSGRAWQVRELAAAAGVGVSTTSEVLRALADRHLVTVVRHGRTAQVRLADPAAVLDGWTRAYDWRQNRHIIVNAPIGDPARFRRRLPGLMHPRYRWALTLQAGASLVAPHATWDRVHVYVDVPAPDRADWRHVLASVAVQAGWSPGPEGRLVLMTPYYATSAWHGLQAVRGLPVVNDLQLVLDLWHYPLRGREQAEHLVEQVLRPRAKKPTTPDAASAGRRARDA